MPESYRAAGLSVALVSDDPSLVERLRSAVVGIGAELVLAAPSPESASLVVLDLAKESERGACADFESGGPPIILVLPGRAGDYDFGSCVGKRIEGFLRRDFSPPEAGAVLAAALRLAGEAARRLELLARSSPDLLIVIDEEGRYLEVFSSDESVLLAEPPSMRGRTIEELLPREVAAPLMALILRATSGQMGGMIEYRLEVRGGLRWFEGRAAPAGAGPGGKRIAVFEARDITERKESEAALRKALDEKDSLLRELQHRVKNNLAMISSLVSIEADRLERDEDRASFERVQDRIRAMALIYDLLYRSDGVLDVELSSYLRMLFESLEESYLGGPGGEAGPVGLELDLEPLGIVVTELATNAIKYAFPGGRRGRISVALRAEGGAARVVIEDDGVGLGAAPSPGSTGTGLRLVELLVDQIDGRLRQGPGAGGLGLRFELELPLVAPKAGGPSLHDLEPLRHGHDRGLVLYAELLVGPREAVPHRRLVHREVDGHLLGAMPLGDRLDVDALRPREPLVLERVEGLGLAQVDGELLLEG
jgi:PAS domain S-box-containing protein